MTDIEPQQVSFMSLAAGCRSRGYLRRVLRSLKHDPTQIRWRGYSRLCPICGYKGRFLSHSSTHGCPRMDAYCPGCGSEERHRLIHLYLQNRVGLDRLKTLRFLHFAPEVFVRDLLVGSAGYTTADLFQPDVDMKVDITAMPFEDQSFDIVMANHVLEHVADDRVALREVLRVLKPTGEALITVPIIEAYTRTHEDPLIQDPTERAILFGQEDHLRIYGRDFPDRMAEVGFEVEQFQVSMADEFRYGLMRGDKVFVGKPAIVTSPV